jgi:transglutaminase-like putative cysteine protease
MDAVSDVMLTTGVSLDKPIARPRSAKEAVLRISGMPEEAMVTDSRQKFEKQADDSFLLTLKAAALPEKSPPLSDAEREKLAESLAPTAFLQSDDPRLKKKSAEIVGGQKDAGKAAALLCDWVFRNVAKEFTPALSNALDTLTSLKGDCGEHTALYVALCRAAGIPAREVAGLAYAEGKLGGHAWAEVYAGGQWVAVDPTFGQHAADALHIKVAEGGMSGIEGMIRLADLMGKIKVQVVSSK